jgi:hypothetical protein
LNGKKKEVCRLQTADGREKQKNLTGFTGLAGLTGVLAGRAVFL